MEPSVAKLVSENAEFLRHDAAADRVVCKLTGHSMPATQQAVSQYVGGKKFLKLKQQQEELKSLKDYEPYIVFSKYHSTKLFCRLTGCLIEKKEAALVTHSEGKKFIMELDRVKKGACFKEEPDPDYAKRVAAEAKAREEEKAKERRGGDSESEEEEGGEGSDGEGGPGVWVPPSHVIDSDVSGEEDGGDGVSGSGSGSEDMDDIEIAAAEVGEEDEPTILEVRPPKPRATPSEAVLKRKAAKEAQGGAAKRQKEEAPAKGAGAGGTKGAAGAAEKKKPPAKAQKEGKKAAAGAAEDNDQAGAAKKSKTGGKGGGGVVNAQGAAPPEQQGREEKKKSGSRKQRK